MEWIETRAKTVDEAIARALSELGIDRDELEFEVLQEPKAGFLGMRSADAHIRARVKPISREKPDRRRRERGRGGGGGRSRTGGGRERTSERGGERSRSGGGQGGGRSRQRSGGGASRGGSSGGSSGRQRQERPERARTDDRDRNEERQMSDVPVEEQAEVAKEFTQGLVDTFDLGATVRTEVEEEHLHILVEGDGLGVLIGPNGATMEAMRELVKTALQRKTEGQNARVHIDVGGYEARRREALASFARDLAERAKESGKALSLEPMPPPDRKVVHDALTDVEGVTTTSEGEEPRRRVVIVPE